MMQKVTIQTKKQYIKSLVELPSLDELQVRKVFRENLPVFSKKNLKIRTNIGVVSFVFNNEQWYIHALIENQEKKTGMVRVIILKGRQQGCSTYVSARYYHRTTHCPGTQTFILTHEGKATDTLFDMVKRFYNNSNSSIKPKLGKCNTKELKFSEIDSSYRVGTADNDSVGRSMNNQQLHASEVAFWRVGEKLAAGVFQSVAIAPDTEIIMESTANGMGNFFHKQWKLAESGNSPYMAIFIPWFWHVEYQLPVLEGFELTDSDLEYKDAHGLSMEQMAWRRFKEQELGEILFKQEYPATPDEAFQVTGKNKLIDTMLVSKARKQKPYRSFGAITVGYDPKRDGMDKDCIVFRQGLNAFGLKYYNYNKIGEKIALCKRILTGRHNNIIPDALFIDYGGSGWEIAGILREDLPALTHKVRVINFGGRANRPELYTNRRNEMWQEMHKWLADANEPPSIPDDDQLHAELVMPGYNYDSKNRKVMESKEKIKKEFGCSTDGGDALSLNFAEPVIINHVMDDESHYQLKLSGE